MNVRARIESSRLCTLALALLLPLVLVGCNRGESGSEESLKRRLEREAASQPRRATVTLGAIHHFNGPDATPPLRAPIASDGELEIREAYLVISAVELQACVPGVDSYDAPEGPLLNRIWERIVPSARAHVASSTTRLGTPYVEDLLAEGDRARIIGKISPPLAAYCRVAAVVAPADADVRNSTRLATEAIVGSSLLVRGRHRPTAEAPWESFEIRTDAARAFEFEALDPRTGEPPLILERRGDEAMLLIDKSVGPETFAVEPADERSGREILERLGASMHVYTF